MSNAGQPEKAVRIVVQGRVQGVGFRAWTQHQAELHGLSGWVRNRADGTVEAVLLGSADLVDVMLKACQGGPRGARVDKVDIFDAASADVEAGGFRLLPTA